MRCRPWHSVAAGGRLVPGDRVAEHGGPEQPGGRLELAELDPAAPASPVPVHERGKQRYQCVTWIGHVVRVVGASADRYPAGQAGGRGQAGKRGDGRPEAGVAAMRARGALHWHGQVDEVRLPRAQLLVAQAPPFHHARPEVAGHHRRGPCQAARHRDGGRVAHVQRERLLRRVAAGEVTRRVEPAGARPHRGGDPEVVGPRPGLDLDDLGAVQRQRLGHQGTRTDPAEVEYPQPGKDLAHPIAPSARSAPSWSSGVPSQSRSTWSVCAPGTGAEVHSGMRWSSSR